MKKVLQIIVVLTSIGIISGGILAGVSNWATPFIEMNKKRATERAIFFVQPEAKSYQQLEITDIEVYQVFDENKNQIGFVVVNQGNGFQGPIRVIFGLDKDLNNLTAIDVLEQVETPGLGTLITEDDFKNQFKNLSIIPQINWVKGKEPSKDNEIKAITGATISSKATVQIINDGISKLKKILSEK